MVKLNNSYFYPTVFFPDLLIEFFFLFQAVMLSLPYILIHLRTLCLGSVTVDISSEPVRMGHCTLCVCSEDVSYVTVQVNSTVAKGRRSTVTLISLELRENVLVSSQDTITNLPNITSIARSSGVPSASWARLNTHQCSEKIR